jgi:hypothetical protein
MAVQMGPTSVADPAKLVAALKGQQPAANPKTPLERLNPDQQILENIKAASVSLERAQQFTNDQNLLMVLNAMGGVLSKALLKFDGQEVMNALRDAVATFPPPVAPGVGAAPGQPQGSPGAPPPMSGPAAPAGMPAPPPVSGVPPQ